jgi:hypothetical protein
VYYIIIIIIIILVIIFVLNIYIHISEANQLPGYTLLKIFCIYSLLYML